MIHLLIICLFLFYFDCYNKNPFPAVAYILSQPANQYLFASFFFISIITTKTRSSRRCKKHPACKPTSSCIFSPYIFYCKKSAVPAAAKPSTTCIISNKRFVLSIVADFWYNTINTTAFRVVKALTGRAGRRQNGRSAIERKNWRWHERFGNGKAEQNWNNKYSITYYHQIIRL